MGEAGSAQEDWISPSNEYSRLISFRMDWLDLLAVQGTLKSLLQHHSSKPLILQHSAIFIVQLSNPHMTTGKTKALTTWTFIGKVMSLLFNMLSQFSSVQFSYSVMSDSLQPHGLQHARPPCHIANSQSLLKLMSIESVVPSSHLILCCPLLLPPSIFPSIRVFSDESVLRIRWPKYWSFSFSISPANEYSGLISLRMDWLDLLAVQGTLKSLLQHHSSKASILQHSAFFTVQLTHPYMTTGKTIALTRQTLVGKECLRFIMCCLGWS